MFFSYVFHIYCLRIFICYYWSVYVSLAAFLMILLIFKMFIITFEEKKEARTIIRTHSKLQKAAQFSELLVLILSVPLMSAEHLILMRRQLVAQTWIYNICWMLYKYETWNSFHSLCTWLFWKWSSFCVCELIWCLYSSQSISSSLLYPSLNVCHTIWKQKIELEG